MPIDLYGMPMCAGCRAVLLTAEAIGVDLNFKIVDLFNGEHHSPEYEEVG